MLTRGEANGFTLAAGAFDATVFTGSSIEPVVRETGHIVLKEIAMFDRIQTLFERFVGVQGNISVPMSAFRQRIGLPAQSARPACWRRTKRVTVRFL